MCLCVCADLLHWLPDDDSAAWQNLTSPAQLQDASLAPRTPSPERQNAEKRQNSRGERLKNCDLMVKTEIRQTSEMLTSFKWTSDLMLWEHKKNKKHHIKKTSKTLLTINYKHMFKLNADTSKLWKDTNIQIIIVVFISNILDWSCLLFTVQ